MPIPSADSVPPRGIGKHVPEYFKGKTYVRVNTGETKTINYVIRKSYQAKDKNYEPIFSRIDGAPVMRVIYYLGFTDGTYTTVKNDIIVGQLAAWLGEYSQAENADFDLAGLDDVQTVKFGERKHKMGDREYPVPVLEVL